MKNLFKIFMLWLPVILLSVVSAQAQWTDVGNPASLPSNAYYNDMVIDGSGNIHCVYRPNGNGVAGVRYNGSSWSSLGGISSGGAHWHSLAMDNSGAHYVLFRDNGASSRATVVKRSTSGSWSYLGGRGFSANNIIDNGIVIYNGQPYAAFRGSSSSNFLLQVKRYTGSSWVNVGGALSSGNTSNVKLVIDNNNVLYVAYTDFGNSGKLSVKKYNGGSSWSLVGPNGISAGSFYNLDFEVDGNNNLYVAYRDGANSNKLTVQKYNGSSWSAVGGSGVSSSAVGHVALTFDSNDNPLVVFSDNSLGSKATVLKYDGTNWVSVGAPGFTAASTSFNRIAVYNGDVYVSNISGGKITVMKTGVNTPPPLTATITAGGATTFCSGDSVVLTANSGSGYTYQWSLNGNPISGATGISYTATASGSYTVTITSGGSSGTSSATVVTVNAAPTATITASGATAICSGSSVTLSANTGTGYSYQWKLNGTNISGATSSSYTASLAGNYTVTTTANGCTATSDVETVTVSPTPDVDSVADQTLCAGASTDSVIFSGAVSGTTFNWTNTNTSIGLAASGSGNINPFTAINTGTSPVSATITVTPKSGSPGYAYIASFGNNRVDVVNRTTNIIVSSITVGTHPEGVSVNADGSRVYVTNDGSNSVSVINTATNTVIHTISVGSNPTGVVVSPDGSRVYVANSGSNTVSVINTATNTVIATVSVGNRPTGIAITPDGSKVYACNFFGNSVSVINATTNTLATTIALTYSSSIPLDVVASNDGSKVYVSSQNVNYVYAISTATNTISAAINIGRKSSGITISPDDNTVYAADIYTDNLSVIDATSNTLTTTVAVGDSPYGASISPDGSLVYVNCASSKTVSVVSTATNTVVNTLTGFGNTPKAIGNFVTAQSPECTGASESFTITVNPLSTATITASGATTFCTGGSVTLSASSASNYQWQIGGVDISGATSSSYVTNNSGNYSVEVTDANGCSATSSVTTVTEKGVWTAAGCPGISTSTAHTTSLAVDTNSIVYAAYSDASQSNKTTVQQYDGNSWSIVGTAGFSSAGQSQSLAVGPDNMLYMAVEEFSIGATVYKYDGSSWTTVGSAGFSPGAVNHTSLAIDGSGVLYVAFKDNANGGKTSVMKYNGTNWVHVGATGISTGNAASQKMAIDNNDVPHVVYADNNTASKLQVYKFNGTSWVSVGGPNISSGPAVSPTIAFDANNTLFAAYKDGFPQGPATVLKYNGTSWVTVGNAGFSQGYIDYITLAFDSQNKLIASYRDDANNLSITTQRFDNGVWTPIGAQGITTNTANQGSFVIDSDDNMYVAFRDFNSSSRLTVMKTGPSPVTTIAANGPTDICSGSSVQLSVSACNGSSYQWMNNGVNISGANSATYTASASGTYTVNITSNGCSSVSDSINVNVKQATVITACASDITLNASSNCNVTATYNVTATGASTPTISYVFSGATSSSGNGTGSGASFNVGVTNVMVVASDSCGNDTCSFTVTVNDVTPPTIACPSDITVNTDNGACTTSVSIPQPTATDNCQAVGNSLNFDGSNDYVQMANSTSLNSYVSTGELTIEFWVKPTDVSGDNTIIAHRNNGNSQGLVFEMIGSNKLACYVRAGGWRAIALYLTPNTWQHVAIVADASSGLKGYINGELKTTKAFVAGFTQSNDIWRIGRNSQSSYPRYFKGGLDEMRIWNTARSESDIRTAMNMELSGSESGLVGYYDMNQGIAGGNNTSPAVNTLIDRTANSNSGSLSNFTLNGSTSNWVQGASTVNNIVLTNSANASSNASGTYNVGTTTVEWIATDLSGNKDTCYQTVTVIDNQDPIIAAPASVTVNADAGQCATTNVALGTPTTSDNCGLAGTTNDGLTSYPVGTTTVTWTVTDVNGNTATATQMVTVVDNQNPTIACAADVTVNADNGACAATNVSLGSPTTGDNCGVASTTNNAPSSFAVGTTTVIWTVTDVNGNTATCTQDVTVIDNQDPTIACPADITVNADNGACAANNVNLGNPTTGDNCGVASATNNAPSSYPVGTTTVTWTVTDVNGNTATCNQMVTVVDNQNPTITCPADVTINADSGVCAATNVSLDVPTTSDNCGVEAVSNNAPATYAVGTTIVTWTVTDYNGNTSTCNQTVTVVDNQAPIVATQNQTIYLNATGSAVITTTDINNGSTDNCGIDNMSLDKTSFDCSNIGANTVTLTVTDIHSNSATGTATVTVVDTVKPVIACPADVTVSCLTTTANTGNATATDACGVDTIIYTDASTYSSNPADAAHYNYTITRTWTATDVNGNSNSCTQTITVQQLKLTASVSNVLCNGDNSGSIDLTATGGVGNLTYNWSNSATTEDVSGLTAGTYTVTVTDSAGCTATATYTVTEPTMLTLTAIGMNPNPTVSGQIANTIFLGYGPQSVTLSSTASGGTPGYSYSWTPTTGVANTSSATTSVSPTATTTYTLTVTDSNGCTKSVSKTIYVKDVRHGNNKVVICHNGKTKKVSVNAVQAHLNHGDQLGECFELKASKTKVTCYGGNDGALDVTVKGGIPPFSYSWSTNDTTEDLTGLSAGNYTLTVTAANNEVTSSTFKVKQNSKIKIYDYVSDVKCHGDSNGKILIGVSGGKSPYTYLWNDNSTGKNRYNLSAGNYSVVVTDKKGCTMSDSFTVAQPATPISVSGTITNVSCSSSYSGGIDLTVSGGTGSYTYYWSKSSQSWGWSWYWWWLNKCNNQDLTGVSSGTYTVLVKDANGCTVTKSFTIAPANKPNVSIAVSPNPTVSGQAQYTIFKGYGPQSVTLSANVSGGATPYTYSWTPSNSLSSNNTANTTASPNNTTKYYVTVTDANGCSETVSRRIYVEDVRWYGERIRICHNGQNKKVSYNSVAAHLAHGDQLGNCNSRCKGCPNPDDEDVSDMDMSSEAATLGQTDAAGNGISQISRFADGIKVYPNPNNGTFTVSLPKHVKGGEITFRDMTGKVIKQNRFLPNAQLKFNMPDVADGMYMIEVKNGIEIYKARVVIRR